MARFDVHRNRRNSIAPLLLDIQSDHLAAIRTRLVVPLVPLAAFGAPIARLHPVFEIAGQRYAMVTSEMAGVDSHDLGEIVASLKSRHIEIVQAVDFLLHGF